MGEPQCTSDIDCDYEACDLGEMYSTSCVLGDCYFGDSHSVATECEGNTGRKELEDGWFCQDHQKAKLCPKAKANVSNVCPKYETSKEISTKSPTNSPTTSTAESKNCLSKIFRIAT